MGRIITTYAQNVAKLPGRYLSDIYLDLGENMKMRVLSHIYRDSRDQDLPW